MTTIKINQDTKELLNMVGKKGETYDDIIKKLAKFDNSIAECAYRKMMTHKIYDGNGIKFMFIESDSNDIEGYVKKHFESMGYLVKKTNPKSDVGVFDFIVKNEDEEIYVEVKSEEDGIRMSQAKWACENPDVNRVICFVRRSNAMVR